MDIWELLFSTQYQACNVKRDDLSGAASQFEIELECFVQKKSKIEDQHAAIHDE